MHRPLLALLVLGALASSLARAQDPAADATASRAVRVLFDMHDESADDLLVDLGPQAVAVLVDVAAHHTVAGERTRALSLLGRMDGASVAGQLRADVLPAWHAASATGQRDEWDRAVLCADGWLAQPLLDAVDDADASDDMRAFAAAMLLRIPHPPDSRRLRGWVSGRLDRTPGDLPVLALAARMGFVTPLLDRVVDASVNTDDRCTIIAMLHDCPIDALQPVATVLADAAVGQPAAVREALAVVIERLPEGSLEACSDAAVAAWIDDRVAPVVRRMGARAAAALCDRLLGVDTITVSRWAAGQLAAMRETDDWPVEVARLAAALPTADTARSELILLALGSRTGDQLAPHVARLGKWLADHPAHTSTGTAAHLLARTGRDAAPYVDAIAAALESPSATPATRSGLRAALRELDVPSAKATAWLVAQLGNAALDHGTQADIAATIVHVLDPVDADSIAPIVAWADTREALRRPLWEAIARHGPRMLAFAKFAIARRRSADKFELPGILVVLASMGRGVVPQLIEARTPWLINRVGASADDLGSLLAWYADDAPLRGWIAQAIASIGGAVAADPLIALLEGAAGDAAECGHLLDALTTVRPPTNEQLTCLLDRLVSDREHWLLVRRGLIEIGALTLPLAVPRLLDENTRHRHDYLDVVTAISSSIGTKSTPLPPELFAAIEPDLLRVLAANRYPEQLIAARLLCIGGNRVGTNWLMEQLIDLPINPEEVVDRIADYLLEGGVDDIAVCTAMFAIHRHGISIDSWVARHADQVLGIAIVLAQSNREHAGVLDVAASSASPRVAGLLPTLQDWVGDRNLASELRERAAMVLVQRFGDAVGADYLVARAEDGTGLDAVNCMRIGLALLQAGDTRGRAFLRRSASLDPARARGVTAILAATGDPAAIAQLQAAGAALLKELPIDEFGPHAIGVLPALLDEYTALTTPTDDQRARMIGFLRSILLG